MSKIKAIVTLLLIALFAVAAFFAVNSLMPEKYKAKIEIMK